MYAFQTVNVLDLQVNFSYTLSLKVVVMLGHAASAGVSRRSFFYFMAFQMAMLLFDWIHGYVSVV